MVTAGEEKRRDKKYLKKYDHPTPSSCMGMRMKINHTNGKLERAAVAILTTNKTDF